MGSILNWKFTIKNKVVWEYARIGCRNGNGECGRAYDRQGMIGLEKEKNTVERSVLHEKDHTGSIFPMLFYIN